MILIFAAYVVLIYQYIYQVKTIEASISTDVRLIKVKLRNVHIDVYYIYTSQYASYQNPIPLVQLHPLPKFYSFPFNLKTREYVVCVLCELR